MFTERDRQLFYNLGQFRLMTLKQIQLYVFNGVGRSVVQRRLGKLRKRKVLRSVQSSRYGQLAWTLCSETARALDLDARAFSRNPNRKTIGNAYNRVLRRLKIDYVSGTQMMRRTSATHANDVTGDFFAVSAQLDHSSLEVTKRYVKRVSSQKRKVADALNSVAVRAFKKSS